MHSQTQFSLTDQCGQIPLHSTKPRVEIGRRGALVCANKDVRVREGEMGFVIPAHYYEYYECICHEVSSINAELGVSMSVIKLWVTESDGDPLTL